MKRNLIVLIGVLCASVALANGQFEKAMAKNIPAVFATKDPEALQEVINQLNRIGEAESDRWEPYYYAAFGYIRMSGMYDAGADKDKYLDLALETLSKGEEIKPNDSELESLRGYIQMMKLVVDPAARGMTYSGLAFQSFQKAIQFNPENPRAHYLMGRMQHGTAQFMGGGNEQACGSLFKALVLYKKGEDPENPLAPTWGQESTEEAIQQICEQKGD